MKCIVLGLDGASHSLLEDHMELLPALRGMKERGASGPLASTILPNSIPAWPVICTGMNPGRLGVFDFLRETPDHGFVSNLASDVRAAFVWELLTDSGVKCGILNIPGSSPFRSAVEFGEGDYWKKDWINFSWTDLSLGVSVKSSSLGKRIEELVDERFDQIDWCWENRDWEFLMINLNSVDAMSHHLWHDREFVRSTLLRIDRRIGALLDAHPELDLIVLSDHGMVPVEKSFWTMNWLEGEGLLFRGETGEERKPFFTRRRAERLVNAVTWVTEKLGIRKLAVKYGRNLGRKILSRGGYDEDIGFTEFVPMLDWERTVAYTHGHQGKIYLNRGNPEVRKDCEGVRADVAGRLRRFFEDRGMNVELWTREELYTGPWSSMGEDLAFIVDDNRVLPQTYYRRDGAVLTPAEEGTHMQAHHHRTGILYAAGPGVRHTVLEGASLPDIAPTVLRLLGFGVPGNMDGRPLDILAGDRGEEPLRVREELLDEVDF